MTVETYTTYIGRLAVLRVSGMDVSVRVLDIRSAYGRIDAKITPVAGEGASWVEFSRLVFINGRKD